MLSPSPVRRFIRAWRRLAPGIACLLLLSLQAPSIPPVGRPSQAAIPALPWSRDAAVMTFELNRGQFEDPARFVGRGPEANVFLSPTRVEFGLAGPERSARVNLRLLEATDGARMRGAGELSGVMHYLHGSDPAGWFTDVPSYERVEVEGVYPGIDLVFRDEGGRLAYDFVVAPGADPGRIRMAFDGAEQMRLDGAGDLILTTAAGELRQRRPFLYQEEAGKRLEVAGRYALGESSEVAFLVGEYDASRPLVIDPSLRYSTRSGRCRAYTGILDVTADADGNAYVVGYYPWHCDRESEDIYVTKYDSDGRLLFGTTFGGWFNETPYGVAVDAAGNIYVTGSTAATFPGPPPFPTVNPVQAVNAGDTDAFVTMLDPTGSAILFSTFLGGTGADTGRDIEVNDSGTIFVTGVTRSTDFPSVGAEQPIPAGGSDAFVAAIDPGGPTLLFSTYLGGSGSDTAWRLSLTPSAVLVTGTTSSADFPVRAAAAAPVQAAFGGGASDAFVARYETTGGLRYATYLGGSGRDEGYGIATDLDGASYVTGATESTDFPTASALQPTLSWYPAADAFLSKLSPSGTDLVYSTYLDVGRSAICQPHLVRGGITSECGGVAVNGQGSAFVTAPGVFVTKVDPTGALRPYTFHGFGGYGIALTPFGEILVAGRAHTRANFPTVNAEQTGPPGAGFIVETGWLAKLSDEPNPDAAFEQDDRLITYTGSWTTETGAEFSGCDAMRSSEPGAKAVISFTGTGLQVIGRRDPTGGDAYVYPDQNDFGSSPRPRSSYGSPTEPRALLFSISGLTYATHTQTIEVAGTGAFWIDGINVLGDPDSVVESHSPCNRAPRAAAAAPAATECSSPAGAELTLDGSASSDEDSSPGTIDDITLFEWMEDAGMPSERPLGTGESLRVVLPLGSHRIYLRVTDASGSFDTDEISVHVVDTIPPAVSVLTDLQLLWPPNHRMVPVVLSAAARDVCDPAPGIALTSVTSNEPDDAPGDGDGRTGHDIQGVTVGAAATEIQLRAERGQSGAGRVYTVTYIARDDSGNSGTGTRAVEVPCSAEGNR
jgi:hypothetical protein